MKKCKIDGCGYWAIKDGELCYYHVLERQSKTVDKTKVSMKVLIIGIPLGIALYSFKKKMKWWESEKPDMKIDVELIKTDLEGVP